MLAFFFHAARSLREIITAEGDVLRRRGNRFAAGWRENIVRREHEHARFHLRLDRERHVHRHLVAVEVRVVGGAHERMNADRFAFDQLRLESLDGQSMKGGRAIQEYGMSPRDFIQDVPNLRRLPLDHFLGAAHGVHIAEIFEPANDERLEENERHLLGQTALMKFQLWTDDNDGTPGIIDALAEPVLSEPSALALEHVAERLE